MTQFASGPGVRLAYEVAGAGDPPMVFVHGWSCDRSYFAPQVGHFSAGHAVAAVLRAMGEFDGAAALGSATVPVLSIGSAAPANSAADLRRACPAIAIGQTVGSGHFIQLEVPDQVNAMIERFLAITGL